MPDLSADTKTKPLPGGHDFLKACPFCGGKPSDISPTYFEDHWSIECVDCAVTVILDSRPCAVFQVVRHDEAIAAWNRREKSVGEAPALTGDRDRLKADRQALIDGDVRRRHGGFFDGLWIAEGVVDNTGDYIDHRTADEALDAYHRARSSSPVPEIDNGN